MKNTDRKIRYECVRCGNCCRWPGPVRVTEKEIGGIAAFLGIAESAFTERYTRLVDNRSALSLTEKPDGSCIFLDGNRCSIQAVKPKQCRDFPNDWNFPGFREECRSKIVLS